MQRNNVSRDPAVSGQDDDDSAASMPSHPLASTLGALALGGATGATVGTAAGPLGTAVGALVGAIAGALGGDALASSIGQASESSHWREAHAKRQDVMAGSSYEDYAGAYALGESVRTRYPTEDFDSLDDRLAEEWVVVRRESRLERAQARPAALDAWEWSSR